MIDVSRLLSSEMISSQFPLEYSTLGSTAMSGLASSRHPPPLLSALVEESGTCGSAVGLFVGVDTELVGAIPEATVSGLWFVDVSEVELEVVKLKFELVTDTLIKEAAPVAVELMLIGVKKFKEFDVLSVGALLLGALIVDVVACSNCVSLSHRVML